MVDSTAHRPTAQPATDAERIAVLQSLVALGLKHAAAQADAFTARLTDALSRFAGRAENPEQAEAALHAAQQLGRSPTAFQRLLLASLQELLQREVRALGAADDSGLEHDALDLSLVTFEAMQKQVLIDNLSQAIDAVNLRPLALLGRRIAHLLQRDAVGLAQNPFRSAVFLRAVSEAWNKFDLKPEAHDVVLHRLQPANFLQLAPVLQELNEVLIARGILPDVVGAEPPRPAAQNGPGQDAQRGTPLPDRLQRLLGPVVPSHSSAGSIRLIHPVLLAYLNGLQKQVPQAVAEQPDAAITRHAGQQAPSRVLTPHDINAIELLAKTFDHVFRDENIPADARKLLGRLQVPILKAALSDKDFFFSAEHPARRLLETVAQYGVACDPHLGGSDPLYQALERTVDCVLREFDLQLEPFEKLVAELDSFVKKEERAAGSKVSDEIAQAKQREKNLDLQRQAERDIATRIGAGDVAGFVEAFLRAQWVRALVKAYRVRESKPEALDNARKTMEDLIWSVKPKASAEERKGLVAKLPALLTQLNTWLNVMKWDGPEREKFFAMLADRHAAVARTPLEAMPRQQLEIAMNVAQKASENRFSKPSLDQQGKSADEFVQRVNCLARGSRVEFARSNGRTLICRLAWVSRGHNYFVFSARQVRQALAFTADTLAQAFRAGQARIVGRDAILGSALAAALDEMAD